jgi:hypothetical protein
MRSGIPCPASPVCDDGGMGFTMWRGYVEHAREPSPWKFWGIWMWLFALFGLCDVVPVLDGRVSSNFRIPTCVLSAVGVILFLTQVVVRLRGRSDRVV